MHRTFSKKSVVITTLVLYLLGEKFGNRLETIDELATECYSSIGLTQAALKILESSGAIRTERRGCNSNYLVETDNEALLAHVDINNVVHVMLLPYTRLYEGLANGLRARSDGISFYYAHMRGTDIHVECLPNGVYDMATVSRLAAGSYPTQEGLCLVLELGPHTCVGERQLICRQGESANVKRVGLDNRPVDQKIMTGVFWAVGMWNVVAKSELSHTGARSDAPHIYSVNFIEHLSCSPDVS